MRQFIFFCLIIFLASCQRIEITRYLEERYCPESLILKGAEQKGTARLLPLISDCDVSWGGQIGTQSFHLEDVEMAIFFQGEAPKMNGRSLNLFLVLMHRQKHNIVSRWDEKVIVKDNLFFASADLLLPANIARESADYIIIGGLRP